MEESTSGKLSNKLRLGYALGAIPNGLLLYIFDLKYIEFFFNDLKLLPIYFIAGQIIYLLINAFNDPLLGQLSDRTNRERWGSRRIIYIKYGGPIWAFAFLIVWFPWSFDNQIIIFIHYCVVICFFDTMFTLVVTVWLALLPEMTSDTGERSKIQFFTLVIGAIVISPFFLLIGEMSPTSQTFKIIVITVTIVSTIMQLVVAKMCKERPEFQKDEVFPLWKSLKECFKLKSFRIYLGYAFFSSLFGAVSLSYLFAYLLILGENGFIIFFLSFIILGFLRIISTATCFFLWLISSLTIFVILGLVCLYFFSGYTIFSFPLLYLSIDEDEVNHGTRRDGMFQGLQALFGKPAVSIGPIIATIILVSYGYVQGSETQSASALFGITLLFLVYPVIAIALSLVFIYYHPLHGEKLEEMTNRLEEIHRIKIEKIQ
ncbi:MAG: MFS transporter [Promethearchaeota archaeon]